MGDFLSDFKINQVLHALAEHYFIIASLQLLTTFENTCGKHFYKFTLSHFREPASRATPFFLWLPRTEGKKNPPKVPGRKYTS
jgi:hypothetical protein